MTLRLNGSTSGYVEIDAPATAGSNSIVLPSGNGSANQFLKNGSTAGTLGWSSMVETAAGVGVGTSTPDAPLSIKETGDVQITFKNSSGTTKGYIGTSGAFGSGSTDDLRIRSDGSNILFGLNGTERMRITSNGGVGIGVTPDSNHRVTIKGADNTSGNFALVVRNSVGANILYLRNDSHFFADSIYNQTTAAGANIHIDGAARLLRVTSSLKYKTNVETLEDSYADAILNVRPVWYQSLGANDNPDWGWWGFIAEEVAEVDPRLVSWKTTEVVEDENGSPLEQPLETPEPEGVHYDRFVPHLLNLIKRQKEQIESQGASIAALEARIAALEVTP